MTRRLPGGAGAALGGFLVLWVFAFGLQQSCTTDERCMLAACPARCTAAEPTLIAAAVLLAILGIAFICTKRFRSRIFAAACAGVIVVSAVVMVVQVRG